MTISQELVVCGKFCYPCMDSQSEQPVLETTDIAFTGNFASLKLLLDREQWWLRMKLMGCGIIASMGLVGAAKSLDSFQHGHVTDAYRTVFFSALLIGMGTKNGSKNKAILRELQETRQHDELYARVNALANYYMSYAGMNYTFLRLQRVMAKMHSPLAQKASQLTGIAILDTIERDTDAYIHTVKMSMQEFAALSFDELGGQQQKEQVNTYIQHMAAMWEEYQNLYNEKYQRFRGS